MTSISSRLQLRAENERLRVVIKEAQEAIETYSESARDRSILTRSSLGCAPPFGRPHTAHRAANKLLAGWPVNFKVSNFIQTRASDWLNLTNSRRPLARVLASSASMRTRTKPRNTGLFHCHNWRPRHARWFCSARRDLTTMRATPSPLFHRIWPPALLILASVATIAWSGLFGYGLVWIIAHAI